MKAKEPKKRSKQPDLFAATGQQSTKKAKREAAQAGLEQQINARAREHVRLRARVGLGALAGGWQAAAHPGPWSLGPAWYASWWSALFICLGASGPLTPL